MDIATFLQFFLSGMTAGCVYALVALCFVLCAQEDAAEHPQRGEVNRLLGDAAAGDHTVAIPEVVIDLVTALGASACRVTYTDGSNLGADRDCDIQADNGSARLDRLTSQSLGRVRFNDNRVVGKPRELGPSSCFKLGQGFLEYLTKLGSFHFARDEPPWR